MVTICPSLGNNDHTLAEASKSSVDDRNEIDVAHAWSNLFSKFKQYKNCQHCQLCALRENSFWESLWCWSRCGLRLTSNIISHLHLLEHLKFEVGILGWTHICLERVGSLLDSSALQIPRITPYSYVCPVLVWLYNTMATRIRMVMLMMYSLDIYHGIQKAACHRCHRCHRCPFCI